MPINFRGYSIKIHPKLEKSLKKNLPNELREVFDRKLKYLSANPSHPSLNTKQYEGVTPATLLRLGVDEVWEFYINRKDYRCIFYLVHSEKMIIIAYVGDHNKIKNKYT